MFQGCINKNCARTLGKKTRILKFYLRIIKRTTEEKIKNFKNYASMDR